MSAEQPEEGQPDISDYLAASLPDLVKRLKRATDKDRSVQFSSAELDLMAICGVLDIVTDAANREMKAIARNLLANPAKQWRKSRCFYVEARQERGRRANKRHKGPETTNDSSHLHPTTNS